jgi:enoyl-CoA hydratase/carnithine racemase
MSYETLLYDVSEHVLTITLNRPDRLNAFTGTMMNELIAAFDAADADDDVRAIIVTGAGRAFCAGADLSEGAKTFDFASRADRPDKQGTPQRPDGGIDYSHESVRDGGGRVSLRIYECMKPVIAAINGPAVGVGATMLLPMDIRIASSDARFGFVFARRGITPEACSSWFLPRAVGISQALEWTYSGRVFPAQEALAGGLVKQVVAPEALMDTARALAREIADHAAPVSVALTRQMMWRMLGADHPMEAHKVDSRAIYADMPDFVPWWEPRSYE